MQSPWNRVCMTDDFYLITATQPLAKREYVSLFETQMTLKYASPRLMQIMLISKNRAVFKFDRVFSISYRIWQFCANSTIPKIMKIQIWKNNQISNFIFCKKIT